MNHYSSYGLRIRSAVTLPEFPRAKAPAEAVDVEIRRASVDPVPESVSGTGIRRLEAEPAACRLTYDGIGSFLVEEGRRILFDSVTERDPPRKVVRRLFANEIMGLVLHQRGELVVHASAVAVDDRAAVFLGPQGAGKSTTAAAFHELGYTTLEDDLVGIRLESGRPVVVPGVPEIRLLPDAIDALDVDGTSRPEEIGDSEKRYKRIDATADPVSLSRCYVLSDGDELALEPVPPRDRVVELIARTYTGGLLDETGATADNFRSCSTITEETPFLALSRPRDHDRLPELVELVARDLRRDEDPRSVEHSSRIDR
ncbi:hypothetical protein [Natrarchaeobius chitinivorans]|uniref:Serine kinase n=1 Tax=Natrarchaeobius chitinivorans TaxID=1679083 RepID=A0A3N6PBM6_NATCH|nr:hypothetical protein [Natrarchaeobius chitinivorans]RQG94015.1 hypothetical protein EA473_13130 [Natrarchaeobius chitinivorans]